MTEPHTDYVRWELALDPQNIDAGEDIRYLPRRCAEGIVLPPEDCWLFDDERLVLSLFKPQGGSGGFSREYDPDLITQYRAVCDQVWSRAVSYAGGSLARLTVREDQSATGPLLDDWGGFMPLRTHQHTDPAHLIRTASQQNGEKRTSHLPAQVTDDGQAWVALADLLMADVSRTDITRADGDVQWLVHPDGSWAYHDTTTGIVEQGGPHRLWDELERIHQLWADNDRPTRNNIGLTVTPNGDHHIWIHSETNIVTRFDGIG